MRLAFEALVLAVALISISTTAPAAPSHTIEEAVALAQSQNPDIAVARQKLNAARGGLIEARSGYLPSVVSTGLFREREHQSDSRLRDEDYNASVRVVQTLYSGRAVPSQVAIARLNLEKQRLELEAVSNRVAMDVRIAFNDLLLNQAKIRVHEQSVNVLQEELKTQQERFGAGTVGQLNVSRAQVALANEQPTLVDAQTQLKNSQLRLAELLGGHSSTPTGKPEFEAAGQLQYRPLHADLNECLARSQTERPEIRARQIEVEIEDLQAEVDRSELRPKVEAFSGYEVYNERDPRLGSEFNYGYVIGINARWHIFDGFATKGKLIATRARRDAAVKDLEAAQRVVASEVRSAFLDLQQADRTLESETKNVQTADESLEIAKANAGAGLGTQLDILQATSDVTRTRTTRLSAIYLHNTAVAHLARACAVSPEALEFSPKLSNPKAAGKQPQSSSKAVNVARPPAKLSQQ
jgi:outer membrane protein